MNDVIISPKIYRKAFNQYLRKGTPIDVSVLELMSKEAERPTNHYIWRTRSDDKVRSSHAANNGRIFAWDNPPPTGHPGEDFGCRCIAEPYIAGKTEYAYQEIISEINDNSKKWTDFDLTKHYYLGDGVGLTLAEIGHLRGIINYFFYKLNKYNDVNAQIINAARQYPSGDFAYSFNNGYGFGDYLYVFGGGVISGIFVGTVKHENGMMFIEGEMQYFYDDVFTDPVSIRELYDKDPKPEEMWWIEKITEFGGTYYPIKDYWKTRFRAEARIFAGASIYHWKNQ